VLLWIHGLLILGSCAVSTRATCSTKRLPERAISSFHARHLFDETTLRACSATMEGSPGKIRLSTLPDDIVFRIMSFLTMRQAVRMCVLSRRWRNLWRTVPCINADISEFKRRDTEHYDQETELAFKMFMERLNELRDPAPLIHTFRFRCILDLNEEINHILDSEVINGWISHAVQKQPLSGYCPAV
jgi:hypothetical protein